MKYIEVVVSVGTSVGQILRVTWTDKRTKWGKLEQKLFCYSQSRKESFLIMVMCYGKKETAWRKKHHYLYIKMINNARYYLYTSGQRTRWQDNNEVDWADWWSFAEICLRQKSIEEDYPWIPPSHRRRGAIAVLLRCQYGINRSGTAMIAVVPQWFRHWSP